ncbi:hypothetical protein M5K25_003986 [Dendrobium thyrsiflorum]|uniref:Uncharacterized protein n=1 Tax=Dendrobium thyrsiflorum TaxID=117978 RepID=A0ABD0VLC6_DENTH
MASPLSRPNPVNPAEGFADLVPCRKHSANSAGIPLKYSANGAISEQDTQKPRIRLNQRALVAFKMKTDEALGSAGFQKKKKRYKKERFWVYFCAVRSSSPPTPRAGIKVLNSYFCAVRSSSPPTPRAGIKVLNSNPRSRRSRRTGKPPIRALLQRVTMWYVFSNRRFCRQMTPQDKRLFCASLCILKVWGDVSDYDY